MNGSEEEMEKNGKRFIFILLPKKYFINIYSLIWIYAVVVQILFVIKKSISYKYVCIERKCQQMRNKNRRKIYTIKSRRQHRARYQFQMTSNNFFFIFSACSAFLMRRNFNFFFVLCTFSLSFVGYRKGNNGILSADSKQQRHSRLISCVNKFKIHSLMHMNLTSENTYFYELNCMYELLKI